MADVHEFVSFRFRSGFDRDAQFRTMAELEPVMLAQDGLIRREWFHSERDGSWVTHLVWVDEESIDAAGERVEDDPHAMDLFGRLDPDSFRYARFDQIGTSEPGRHLVFSPQA